MKKIFKKLTISIIILMTMISCVNMLFTTNSVQADENNRSESNEIKDKIIENTQDEYNLIDTLASVGTTLVDGVAGVLVYGYRIGAFCVISIVRGITVLITSLGGGDTVWSIEGIIFTGATGFEGSEIVSVDFFNLSTNSTVNAIRQNVAIWYYAIRNLAIVVSLGILLYVGIRMAISTVASDEAKYKKMFKDWVVSLVLIFVLHYIMIFTIELNNTFVTLLYNALGSNAGSNAKAFSEAMDTVAINSWDPRFTVGVSNLIVYGFLVGVTIIYLFMYIKRMLTVGFLIVISPLITITYSIDKMGDGHSQALNTWLKEFVYNVLIQTFHCIIYIVFINVAIGLMSKATLSASVLAIVMMIFTFQAEGIIKNIFNFQSSSIASAIGSAAAIASGISMMNKMGDKAAKKGINTSKFPKMNKANRSNRSNSTGSNVNNSQNSNTAENNMNSANSQQDSQTNGQADSQGNSQVNNSQGDTYTPQGNVATNNKKGVGTKLKNYAKSLTPEKILRNQIAGGMMLAMGAIGAATGGGKGITSGIYAGKAMSDGIGAMFNKRSANKYVENSERSFAGHYRNLQADSGRTDAQMSTFTQNLLDGNYDPDKLTEAEHEYVSNLRKMQRIYSIAGESDIEARMQQTLDMIHDGTITPDYAEMQQEPNEEPLQFYTAANNRPNAPYTQQGSNN